MPSTYTPARAYTALHVGPKPLIALLIEAHIDIRKLYLSIQSQLHCQSGYSADFLQTPHLALIRILQILIMQHHPRLLWGSGERRFIKSEVSNTFHFLIDPMDFSEENGDGWEVLHYLYSGAWVLDRYKILLWTISLYV